MEFDESDIAILKTLNKEEAKAYILFLKSEERRHAKDIISIRNRIQEVADKFNWEIDKV